MTFIYTLGFKLTPPPLSNTPLSDVELPEKLVQLERERAIKWATMVRQWDRYNHSSTLHRRVNKGTTIHCSH